MRFSDMFTYSLTQGGRNFDSGEFMLLEAQELLPMTWLQLSPSDWIPPNFCSYFRIKAEHIIPDTCGTSLEQDNVGTMGL